MKIKYNVLKNTISLEDEFTVDMDEDDENRADRSVCTLKYTGKVTAKGQKAWRFKVDTITLIMAGDDEGGFGVWCEKYIEEKRDFIAEGNIMEIDITHEDAVKFLNQ